MNKTKAITYFALLTLLVIRFPAGDFVSILNRFLDNATPSSWINTLGLVDNITYHLWERYSFVIAGFVILVYRGNLKKIKVDRIFLVLFVASGILFCRFYFLPVGWVGLLLSGYIAYMLLKNKFDFENDTRPSFQQVIIVLIIVFVLHWLFKINFAGFPLIDTYFSFFLRRFPFWIVEELIFRSLLWVCLEELGWTNPVIVLMQALLFWFFHTYYMFSDPILFWVLIPIASSVMGILVLKYKSITPSSIVHTLFNLR